MLRKNFRFFSSLELTPTFPPRLQINLPSTIHEFILDSNKTVGDLIKEIKQEDSVVKSVTVYVNDKQANLDGKWGVIAKNPFHLAIDSNRYYVYPGIAQFISGNEEYLGMCKEAGIAFNDARVISNFLERLDDQLLKQFTQEELREAATKTIKESNQAKAVDIEILKSQVDSLQVELEPLEKLHNEIIGKSEKYAKNVINGGLLVLLSQWTGIGYGTFISFGWDVMEPVSYVVGSTWALIGYIFFMRNRTEFEITSFRSLLFNKKFDELVAKESLDLRRIEILKRSIFLVKQQMEFLSSK